MEVSLEKCVITSALVCDKVVEIWGHSQGLLWTGLFPLKLPQVGWFHRKYTLLSYPLNVCLLFTDLTAITIFGSVQL